MIKSSGASGTESFGAQTGLVAVRIGAIEVPTDAGGAVWIHFTRPVAERFVPAWAVLEGQADPALLAGHIVLIGTSAAGLRDLRATPLDAAGPGVEIQAQLIEQILTGEELRRPDWAAGAETAYILGIGLVLILLLPRLGPLLCAAIGAATAAVALASSWLAFSYERLLFDPLVPALTVLALYLAATLIGYVRTEGERMRVRNAFAHYLSPSLVEQLAARSDRLQLGGELRTLTVMFCDIRGFTAISERHSPVALTRLMNRFFTPMTKVILQRRGTIDKYIGDCIMAFWNAPLDDPQHAANACRAALAMRRKLAALNDQFAREAGGGQQPERLRFGIALNTGECLVGNLGSKQRFNYSALGDAVNVASRLEGQCKAYGADLIVSESTRLAAEGFATLELDRIALRGRAQPVVFHVLAGDAEMARSAEFLAQQRVHEAMLAALRRGDDEAAAALLAQARALDCCDLATAYAAYADRLALRDPASASAGATERLVIG